MLTDLEKKIRPPHTFPPSTFIDVLDFFHPPLGCANKDLDGSLGSMGKFIDYCRSVALLPVIPYTQRNNWEQRCNSTILYEFAQRPQISIQILICTDYPPLLVYCSYVLVFSKKSQPPHLLILHFSHPLQVYSNFHSY